ncbi:unnamed protein product [Anisakis simplex]|uniref:RFX1_trans_act domain-containing protein n=1 Tax=Anisakis simplex TaxID=6269 RepID=A0A0M3KJ30_ANISI|nr:unnamed protein product [Anisakis simplex]
MSQQANVPQPPMTTVSTSSGNVPAQSPGGASSAADESLDDSKSLRGASPASWPHTPAQLSQGQVGKDALLDNYVNF